MRAALLLLLLVNLAYFGWAQWLAPKEAALPVSPAVKAPRLQLATEAAPPVATSGRCVTVGPFATQELAARARQTLTDSGYASNPREVPVSIIDGYWVYLESPTSEANERKMLDRLKRGGITDAQPMGDPGQRRISLGIFSDEARAASQSERVGKLGLLPQIEARMKQSTTLWLDLNLKSDAPPLEGQKFAAGDSELEFRPCPVAGAPSAQSEAPAASSAPQ